MARHFCVVREMSAADDFVQQLRERLEAGAREYVRRCP